MSNSGNSIFKRDTSKAWHDELWVKVVSVITIFGAGVTTGLYVNSNDHKIELMRSQQECNEKLHAKINEYRDCKIAEQEEKIDELKTTVKILEQLNGKPKAK